MDQDPRQDVPEPIALRKSFQKLEIEDGERTLRFWGRLWSRLGLKKQNKAQAPRSIEKDVPGSHKG
jgi:hypothetical protein